MLQPNNSPLERHGEPDCKQQDTATSDDRHDGGPYTVFTTKQKTWIVVVAGSAAWYSTASSFIYFPAIPFMSQDLGVSVSMINLTVTSYLIASGLFPALTGTAADRLGRRPVFVLSLGVYLAANIGLALQKTFPALFIIRMLQSAAISGSFSIAYGVIGDLIVPAERGGYTGILSIFLNTPPSVAPLISGLLLIRWQWPSIFWFLSIISTISLAFIILLLPETCRAVVGNGCYQPSRFYHRPFIGILRPATHESSSQSLAAAQRPVGGLNPLSVLTILRSPGNFIAVACFAIYYTVYSCLQASLSTIFVRTYGVSGLVAGLTYLPFGLSCVIGSYLSGRMLDRDYKKTAKEHGFTIDRKSADDLRAYPIEQARLSKTRYFIIACAPLIIGYGWTIQAKLHMSIPLVLQFLIGLTNQHLFTSINTLLVDLNPNTASTIQAASNLLRCELAAGALAGLDTAILRLGSGWCFVIFGVFHLLTLVPLVALKQYGVQWRTNQAK
jgi:MFS family permease